MLHLAVLHGVHLKELSCLKHRIDIGISQEFHCCYGKSSNKERKNCLLPQPQQHSILKNLWTNRKGEMVMEVEVEKGKMGRQQEQATEH